MKLIGDISDSSTMSLNSFIHQMRPEIEEHLKAVVASVDLPGTKLLHEMVAYHLGWVGEGAGRKASGKRIRPLLLTLTTAAAGGEWRQALPAAAAVELIHNFSLVHDDIQDNSPLRRGRPTVWAKWGIAQAINAGDTLFALAQLSILDLRETLPPDPVIQAACLLQGTSLHLTQGQYLDLDYETRDDLTIEDYWPMVSGKTAALLSSCCEIGALVAGASKPRQDAFRQFGHYLGLAFQVRDDLLGIWGDSNQTGKSAQSDLLEGKKSLPVLFGLDQKGAFADRWVLGPIQPGEVAGIAELMITEGARDYVEQKATELTQKALQALELAAPKEGPGLALMALTDLLLKRDL